jgi:hypothetical protein
MSGPAFIPPRLTLRVGVTGHRPDKLAAADLGVLEERAREVLTHVGRIARAIQAENDAANGLQGVAPGPPHLKLATAIAEGADRIVTEAAVAAGYRLNVILPFPRTVYARDFEGPARDGFDRLCNHEAVERLTELELPVEGGDPEAYAAAGHLMLAHSDILIAIWDGSPAAGLGGTAEIVAEAQRRELVVVWLALDGSLWLWTPGTAATDAEARGSWQALRIDAEYDPRSNLLAARVHALLARQHQ